MSVQHVQSAGVNEREAKIKNDLMEYERMRAAMFKSSFKPLPPTPMPDNPYKPVKSSVVFATAPIQGDSLSQYSGNNYVSLAPDYQAILSMIPDEEIALCLLRRAIPHTTLHPNVLKSFLLPFIHHDQVNNALKTVISENKSNPPT